MNGGKEKDKDDMELWMVEVFFVATDCYMSFVSSSFVFLVLLLSF